MDTTLDTHAKSRFTSIDINGEKVIIRPIQKNDKTLEANFIDNLSAEAKHYRFLGGINHLSEKSIADLCNVDYHDSMAFVAVLTADDSRREIGAARYYKDSDGDKHEMAIAIADEYRNTELASELLKCLIHYGREHGVQYLYSIELYNNPLMQNIADKFSMHKAPHPDDVHQVIYTLIL